MAYTKLPSATDDEKLLSFLKPVLSQQGELSFTTELLQYVRALGCSPNVMLSIPRMAVWVAFMSPRYFSYFTMSKLILFDPVIPFDKHIQNNG